MKERVYYLDSSPVTREWHGRCLSFGVMLKILIIDEHQQSTADLCEQLIRAGYQVAAVLPSSENLLDKVLHFKPDVILIETDSPSRDTLEHLAVMDRTAPRPVVLFGSDDDSETIHRVIQAGVSTYVVDGLDSSRLKPVIDITCARFEMMQGLRNELARATQKLDDRKIIDKAKGILMKQRHLEEDAAYASLRKLAMARGKTIAQVARDLIDSASLLF
ncbi:ANTAR domain-containing protein [Ferrovum sp.]|uniref:ANTAR domain-containing response regulator n=1 Tax=Ferrovum sp. TaxID=2609467 RepID=UPI0026089C3D|nr:ANTAR domain-containing protein [Ferrovum sp.]